MSGTNIDLSLVIPVYNEETVIVEVIREAKEALEKSNLSYEIIVVDDASTDATRVNAESTGATIITHEQNTGYGGAVKTGIKAARGPLIAMTDADSTYPVADIPRLVAELGDSDMIIGSRVRDHGPHKALRVFAKALIRWLACFLTNTHIPDLNSGLRVVKREEALRFFPVLPNGFSWVSTITVAMLTNGYKVTFTPIEYFPRQGRVSHFHPLRDTWRYLRIVVLTVIRFNPIKAFLVVAILAAVFGAIFALPAFSGSDGTSFLKILGFAFAVIFLLVGIVLQFVSLRKARAYRKSLYSGSD